MKKLKHNFKKGMAFVLSLAMVAGLVPAMSGGANKVQAAPGSGTEPSVSAYATKEQLMDETFAPNADGTAVNIGKLVFGKNSSGNPQQWYILGKDNGVSGDNTIIFASSPIATGQVFNSDTSDKTYDSTTVNANHYGASDFRVALQNMATNTSYFTTAEQGLMNPTTVTTNNTKNSINYTTTDKLYALAEDGYGSTTIKAGTNNQTVLAMSKYWSRGSRGTWFWLRSPYGSNVNYALLAIPDSYVDYNFVEYGRAVQPASNLNLSSVLFASAAQAASSDTAESYTIALEAAMTLRLDGTGKNIGTVTYNTTTGDIKATKGSTEDDVALVVQGKDGTNNWYYSKQITGTEVVNITDIVSETNTPASIDLSACKIWLETTDSTENLTYAVEATETTIIIIHSVAITDIETPVSNTALDTEASCVTTGVSSTTPQITWTPSDSTAGYNTSYTASIKLTADTGYEFIDSTTATVSGNDATGVTKNADGILTVTYAFSATAKDKLTSITAPQAITVANGTAYSAMNLPATVNIVTEGNTVTSAPVTWNTTTPASGSYDPAVLTQQTVTLTGTVTCPDSIDANEVSLTTTITITISAAGIVGAPTANPTAGTYSKNQSVALSSSTEGATIYYTTDGSDPTITGGAPSGTTAEYTEPILVTGKVGQSVETTIKAIAVKDRMQNSSVSTFTYTIQIPYTYVTKTQLMDGTFAPKADGTAVNIGKLVFGKNSSGNPQEWYILGKDESVSGDNTIIFAASPIATNQVFENDYSNNKDFQSSFGVYASNPSKVYPNHYGASDLRVALQGMATNTSYFTSAEQGLMNATTVTTKDSKIDNTYTTTDKLYALAADGSGSSYKTIKAGTSGSTVLAMSSYWSSGDLFWLRSPYDDYGSWALLALPGSYVGGKDVFRGNAVRPASNLNLSSVLFASSAKAASSDTVESDTIAPEAAMTLRLNGTGKNIGTVTYNTTTGDIKAVNGSTLQTVALVVQGKGTVNGEEKDWYYSKKIDTSETINVSAIEAESNTPASIDLSTCKIWLEITDTNGLIYAVGAEKEIEKINTTYVTKEQLMNSFKPYSDGTAVNTGKLVFGKKSDGTTAQEWYILGKDGDVLGDNTIIFAASPIATNQVFEDDSQSIKTYDSSFGVYTSAPTDVFPNHYGASDLRVALQNMATSETYFTSAEQVLMNDTTVTTKDTNSSVTYTTTDKLYALAADCYGSTTIKAGTNNQTVLAMSKYWSSGDWFWLRSPDDDDGSDALLAAPGDFVDYYFGVDYVIAVQPASNLNLSSVLFASAATAASSDTVESYTIALEAAMTLRLDGTGKDIGTVTYNNTTGDIKAVKGSTSQAVALVVQGNDGTNNWYYSKQITGTEGVNASDIKSALSLTSDIDLSACKIWLEITEDNLTYAVNATETTIKIIHSVAITGIATPAVNTTLDTSASCATEGVGSTTPQITWTPNDTTAGYNTSYMASITLTADTGYEFTDSTTATVLGNSATSVNMNTDGTLTVTYAFPATAKDKLTSITAPQAITVANGTAYDAMNLPATVNIVTEGNTVTSAQVKWDTTTPASGSYEPAVLTQQTVTLNGTVDCPDGINANGVKLTTTITITISAAGIVGAPTANPTAGTYSKNQSVALSSSTEGATIYYTTDGSEPTITGGVLGGTTAEYTAPIAVTGTEGQSVTTTIKAIAVKNGMQDSSVETFTYTIHQIPVAKYTYATKTQLMDGTFAPITDGTAVNIGKLVFGKNRSGNPQEWYILGKDESVSGDNTIIFAANPIKKQEFEVDKINNKTESSLWSDCDYSDVSITEVCPNHYGASDLRVALKGMATNISYFTTAEQGLMNATTVTTYDKNNRVTYTTTDNLYALQGDYLKDKLWAGTGDSTVLARSSYWSSGDEFWLRSPSASNVRRALYAIPGDYVRDLDVDCYHAVQPASNLNLSSVLFASSAKAASSDTVSNTIASETAMTLRFDGTGKDIGTVSYNATTGDIKATKGSTEGDVALVVQGNDGTNDWYYSKKIDAAETVNASDIKSALKLSSDIDLSTCKIWLETTDSTENLTYAVEATETTIIVSPSSMLLERGVSVSNISMNPVDGKVKVGEKVTVTTNDMLGYRFMGWYLDSDIDDYQLSGGAEPQSTSFTYTFIPEDNMSLVAVYEAAGNADVKISGSGFTVSVDDGVASAVQDGTYSEKLSIGSKVTITIVEENSNFINWSNENNKIVSTERTYTFTVTGQTTLTMSKKGTTGSTAMVEFVSAYNQVISGKIYSSTDTISFPDGPSKMGYIFKGWSLSEDEIHTKISDGETHITVTPVYEQDTRNTYTVTVYIDGVQDDTQTETGILSGTTKTVKAPTVDGRVFLYWTDAEGNILGYDASYFMQINKDIIVKAVYGEAAVEAKPVIAMTNVFTTNTNGKNKISFTVTRDIPEGYTLVEHGVLYNKLGTIDNPSEDTFVLGGTGVSKYTSTATKLSGIVTLNVNMTGVEDTKVVTRGYMIVKNSEGNDEIYYSDIEYTSYNERK